MLDSAVGPSLRGAGTDSGPVTDTAERRRRLTGLGDLLNSGLGKAEDGWNAGKNLVGASVGEGVGKGTDFVGETLDKIGAHDLADTVEYVGDSLASDLGATRARSSSVRATTPSI